MAGSFGISIEILSSALSYIFSTGLEVKSYCYIALFLWFYLNVDWTSSVWVLITLAGISSFSDDFD